jgi:hypothetical protein
MEKLYLNNLMTNYSIAPESPIASSRKTRLNGGKLSKIINTKNVPNGGFPPIYKCTNQNITDIVKDTTNSRLYSKHQQTVSIKDIITNRLNIEPFL